MGTSRSSAEGPRHADGGGTGEVPKACAQVGAACESRCPKQVDVARFGRTTNQFQMDVGVLSLVSVKQRVRAFYKSRSQSPYKILVFPEKNNLMNNLVCREIGQ